MRQAPERDIEMADADSIRTFRRMTPTRRVNLALGMHDTARHLARAGVRRGHADWSEAQVSAEVGRRMRGEIYRNR